MERMVRLKGGPGGDGFAAALGGKLDDCGIVCDEWKADTGDVVIYEVAGPKGLEDLPAGEGRGETTPYLIYTEMEMDPAVVSGLRQAGLAGVIGPDTPVEEVSFLVNRALFYTMVMGRNPRLVVDLPVEYRDGERELTTRATLLSRDGMFVVTLNPPAPGTECDVAVELPCRRISTGARVLYRMGLNRDLNIISDPDEPFKRLITHPGMAVFFTTLPEADRSCIDDFIASSG